MLLLFINKPDYTPKTPERVVAAAAAAGTVKPARGRERERWRRKKKERSNGESSTYIALKVNKRRT